MNNIKKLIGKLVKAATVQGYVPSQQAGQQFDQFQQRSTQYKDQLEPAAPEQIPNKQLQNPGGQFDAAQLQGSRAPYRQLSLYDSGQPSFVNSRNQRTTPSVQGQ